MMKAIRASKKKNDRLDARKTADVVRCHLPGGSDEEQSERRVDGSGRRVQQESCCG
jgi:hypothetical protein